MKKKEIRVSDCVHYRGFRYGGFGHNIYEDYVSGLARGLEIRLLRKQFIKRVLAYRGADFSAALNIVLSRSYPPWIFPWTIRSAFRGGFTKWSPENNPDIICHYAPNGLLASHINREFAWCERAYKSVVGGYQPELFGYVRVMAMNKHGRPRYLVLDGNHRLSSLHVTGCETVLAEVISPSFCSLSVASLWPGVLGRTFTLDDARTIFNRYFLEQNVVLPESAVQSLIIDEPLLVD